MDIEKIKRMQFYCHLLPEPGDQVVKECLDEILRLNAENEALKRRVVELEDLLVSK